MLGNSRIWGSLLMASLLSVTLVGCGGSSSSSAQKTEGEAPAEASAEATGEEEQKAEEQKKEEPEKASKYAVTIDGVRLAEDYAGAPCVIVDYTFTNVSDEDAASMMVALQAEVYQNGVQCDRAITSEVDSQNEMNKVKMGSSTPVSIAYSVKDTSDIEIEVKEMLSFDNTLLASGTYPLG